MRIGVLIGFAAVLLAACNTTEAGDRRSDADRRTTPSTDQNLVEVKLILPGGLEDNTGLALTHYLYETRWRDEGCKVAAAQDEKPFTGRDVLRLRLLDTCDYRISLAIGFYDGSTWNSVYEAAMMVDPKRDSKSATQVFVERTFDGEKLGFPADLRPLTDIPDLADPTTPPGPRPDNAGGDNTDLATADLTDVARNDPDGDGIVEFRIPPGTGRAAWNTAATTVRIKVGQTLRIFNDDSSPHQMHTNGAPCRHGNVIASGSYGDCKASRPYNGDPLYDHNTRGSFFIEALP